MTSWNPIQINVLPETLRKCLHKVTDSKLGRRVRLTTPDGASAVFDCAAVETRRRIPPSRSYHVTGRFPMRDRGGTVEYESILELSFLRVLKKYQGVQEVWTQAPTVACYCEKKRLVTTPDIGVVFNSEEEIPEELKVLGFEQVTLIEIKPEALVTPRVLCKVEMLKRYTGIQTLLITDVLIEQLVKGSGRHAR